MIEHYNAFISYKHAELDNRIAAEVQNDLEHFHIPHRLKKKPGIKTITRIFRDKDELPTTSNLSDEISYALTNSDYLIVICSRNTKESQWVPREIEYFLRNHERQQVLTVLADGEPEEVIPPILTYEERSFVNEYGQSGSFRIPLEPLSCDYRLPRRQAKKTELPRLAATLMGCSYDELMQRNRQYKIHRLTAIFSAILLLALVFSGYMIYSRARIQENYRQSLLNRSKYLANASEQLMDDAERLTALHLALAALPSEDSPDMPVSPQAVRALTRATLAYTSLSGSNIETEWVYELPFLLSDFKTSPSGSQLAAYDTNNNLKLWATGNHKELLSLNLGDDPIVGISFTGEDCLLVLRKKSIVCYSAVNGQEIWNVPTDYSINSEDISLGTDKSFYLQTGGTVYKLSLENGSQLASYVLLSTDTFSTEYISKILISPDNLRIAYIKNDALTSGSVGIYTLSSGVTQTVSYDTYVEDICWYDDNRLLTATNATNGYGSASYGEISYGDTEHTMIRCLAAADLSTTWEYDLISNNVVYTDGFLPLPGQKMICCYSGNISALLSIDTGEELYLHNVNDSIIHVSDTDGNGWPRYVTNAGTYCNPRPDMGKNSINFYHSLPADLQLATEGDDGIFVNEQTSTGIIYYGFYVDDKDWTRISDTPLTETPSSYCLDSASLSFITTDDSERSMLTIMNPNTGSTGFRIPLHEDLETSTYHYHLLGSWLTRFYYLDMTDSLTTRLMSVDLAGGEASEIMVLDMSSYNVEHCLLSSGTLFYIGKTTDGEYALQALTLSDLTTKSYSLGSEYLTVNGKITASRDLTWLAATTSSGTFLVNTRTGNTEKLSLPEDWQTTTLLTFDNEGHYALTDGRQILIRSLDGAEVTSITRSQSEPIALVLVTASDNTRMLVVPCNDGTLYYYNAVTGAYISENLYSTYTRVNPREVTWNLDPEKNILYLKQNKLVNMIDLNDRIELAYIENCLGRHEPTDRFFTTSYTSSSSVNIGYFRHYTLEELIEKGHNILQGSKLPDKVKAMYGLEEKEEP